MSVQRGHDCEACTRPITDTAVICVNCGYQIDAALTEILDHLAEHLEVTLTRQAKLGAAGGRRPTETPMPFHDGASEALRDLHAVLVRWARVVIEGTGAELPADSVAAVAKWMRRWVGWLRYHEAAAEAYTEITTAVKDAWRIIDRPPDLRFAGPCTACETTMYARVGGTYVTCPNPDCRQTYAVEECREWMRSQLEDELGGPTRVARICAGLGVKISESTIRKWRKEERIHPRRYDPPRTVDGEPLAMFRVGDVIRIAAGEDIYATEKAVNA